MVDRDCCERRCLYCAAGPTGFLDWPAPAAAHSVHVIDYSLPFSRTRLETIETRCFDLFVSAL